MAQGEFDPTQYGAVAVSEPGEFDPAKYGAVPIKASRVAKPSAAQSKGLMAPEVPSASQAYQQGLQSASQQGTLGQIISKVGSQILPAYHAAVENTLGTPTVSEAITNLPVGLKYEFHHPIDAASLLAKGYANAVMNPLKQAAQPGLTPEQRGLSVLEGVGNVAGIGTPAVQAGQAASRGEIGKAIGTAVPLFAQIAMGGKVPEDIGQGVSGVWSPEAREMAGGLKTAAGDTITPSMGTVAAHGGVPSFQRVVSQIPGGQALRELGQKGINDAASAYTKAMIRVGEEASAPILDKELAKYPERDIGMRTQVVGEAIRQHASSLYDQLDQSYAANPKVFEPVSTSLSQWADSTLKKSEIDRLMSASPEFGNALRKSLEELQKADYLKAGTSIGGQTVSLMANYRNARSDLKGIQMAAKSSRDRMVAGQAVDELDAAIQQGFDKTGNSSLNTLYQEANQRYRQGMALTELGQALEPAYRNIEPENQIGVQKRPTVLSAKKVEDALTELSKVPVKSNKSPFQIAVPTPVDQQTIHQIASFLVKNEAAGGNSIAGQFGQLRMAEAPGEVITNPTRPLAATAYIARLPIAGKVLAGAMSNKVAATALLEFMNAKPGTAHAAAAAARLNAAISQQAQQ